MYHDIKLVRVRVRVSVRFRVRINVLYKFSIISRISRILSIL